MQSQIDTETLTVLEHDEEQVPRCCRTLDDMIDADEQLGLRVVIKADLEIEHYNRYLKRDDDGRHVGQPWFTTSVDNLVVEDEATQADAKRSAGGWSDIADEDNGYPSQYAHIRFGIFEQKKQKRNYFEILNVILHASSSKQLLEEMKKMAVRYGKERTAFLSPWDQKILNKKFNQAISALKK